MFNSFILPTDRNLSGATTPDHNELFSDGIEEVLDIPQSSSITGASLSNCLASYPEHLWGGSYPTAKKQSVNSTAPADWGLGSLILIKQPALIP